MTPASWSPQRGLEPTPDQARDWLDKELHGSGYDDPWLDSVLRWIIDHLRAFLEGAGNLAGLSPVITVLVALVVIVLLGWVLPRVRRESVATAADGAVLEDLTITPSRYRDRAAKAFAAARYDDAALDWFRAIAKDMSDRTLLDDSPGRTAHEASLALAPLFPDHAERLVQAADLFDAVRYGHRRATEAQADLVRRLDMELIKARPTFLTASFQDLSV